MCDSLGGYWGFIYIYNKLYYKLGWAVIPLFDSSKLQCVTAQLIEHQLVTEKTEVQFLLRSENR